MVHSDDQASEKTKRMANSGIGTSENPKKTMHSNEPTPGKPPQMVNCNDPTSQNPVEAPPMAPPADVENQASLTEISSILKRWRREDLLKKGTLFLRIATLFFSFISFMVMATNKHGNWKDFNEYEEFRYCVAISVLAIIYCGAQVLHQLNRISTGKDVISLRKAFVLDFFGDQILSYLLISSASAAIPMTDRMREGADNVFTDSCASAISMTFFAFITLALSAMISGFKLSNQNYF